MIKNIVVIGGGAAGWLTAGVLAADHGAAGIKVTLIESPDIPTIGVGEGTWPTMRATLQKLGLSETEFIRSCDVSLKQGSKFVGWRNGNDDDVYYHPFTAPVGFSTSNIYAAWKHEFSDLSFGDAVTVQGRICDFNKAPKQITTPEYAGVLSYGYHLNAGKFGELLKAHCTAQLGVNHIVDHVVNIISLDNGDISAVVTQHGGEIFGDLFVDCSGTKCLLLGEHFNVGFVDKKCESINDRAMAVQVPYKDGEFSEIASATIATAQSNGWTWDIGLSSRRGVGYVYSSAHVSDDKAEQELRNHILKSVTQEIVDNLTVRIIPIRSGHREKFWHRNCVAVGMAAGFIEPLEASALALVELSVKMISDELPMTRKGMEIVERRFNQIFRYRWEKIIEFLKLHYVLSSREDTEYWRDVRAEPTIPDGLSELLELWQSRSPQLYDFIHTEELFPYASYQYVLYGMGFNTALSGLSVNTQKDPIIENMRTTQASFQKYKNNLPSNREFVEAVMKYRLQKI